MVRPFTRAYTCKGSEWLRSAHAYIYEYVQFMLKRKYFTSGWRGRKRESETERRGQKKNWGRKRESETERRGQKVNWGRKRGSETERRGQKENRGKSLLFCGLVQKRRD